jgi:hypothetical protein
MSFWRIRVTLSDDPHSLALFNDALTLCPVSLVRLESRGDNVAEMSGEVIVELNRDEHLGDMLTALHHISRQVHVSRADPDAIAAAVPQLAGRG